MAQIKRIFIISGEASGDINAGALAKEILRLNPEIKISAVGGEALRNSGADIFYDIKGLGVIGFFDVLKKLPKFFGLKKLILEKIKTEKPDAIILVDFSGFNLRLAKAINLRLPRTKVRGLSEVDTETLSSSALRPRFSSGECINNKIPVFYYTSPQVWASRKGRIKTIKKYISKMLVFFKFEEEFYKKYGIDVEFVGHPLLDIVSSSMEKKEPKTTITLLPGSRKQEVKNILPVMLEACAQINLNIKDMRVVIAKSTQVDWEIYNQIIQGRKLDLKIIEGKTYDCLNMADFCLVASGTATLETAIMQKPFVIIYKMNLLNYLLYRPQVKVPYIGMVNIVAGKKIIPEFIQFQARPEKIADEVIRMLQNPPEIERMKSDLAGVKSLLGEKGASSRAAQIIVNSLNQ